MAGPLIEGVTLVESQLRDALSRSGITSIDAVGKSFDPNLHEAVLEQPRRDAPQGTVVEVIEPGYALHDRVLRPAKVVVAAEPKA
jgi:molecular chaperone GrpE